MTVDWHALFVPHHSLIELILRGSINYDSPGKSGTSDRKQAR